MTIKKIDSFKGRYRWLSNFWPCKINYKGYKYVSTEHAYQASKVVPDSEAHTKIMEAATPGESKRIVRKFPIRPDWDHVRDQVMLDITRLKYEHPKLREFLLATGDDELIEGNTWGDIYWGVCNGVGQNKLGKILMQVREEIRNELAKIKEGS